MVCGQNLSIFSLSIENVWFSLLTIPVSFKLFVIILLNSFII